MKVIILCGGMGTRLKEETEFKPKPMVYVGENPIIWHIMKIYAHYGYNEFILALGYKANYIKDFFLNQKAFTSDFTLNTASHETEYYLDHRKSVDNFTITFVDTGLETLPGERILKCADYLPREDNDFMVTYGDGVSDINISEIYNFHMSKKTIGTITGVHPRSKYGIVEISDDNMVEKFAEKPVLADWVNGGYMIFKKEALKFMRAGETEHPALVRLAKKNQLSLYKHDGFWKAVDTYKELEELQEIWASGRADWKIWQ